MWYRLASLPVDPSAPLKTFTGMTGGWVDLKLVDSQQLNHNVKCLRFSLPDPAQVAGLPIGCKIAPRSL